MTEEGGIPPPSSGAPDADSIPSAAQDAYWGALSDGDGAAAVEVALRLKDDGHALVDIVDGLVAPAQSRVGAMWAGNHWNVAEEHRATSISEEVVAALSARSRPAPTRGRAVVSCVDGEWHALPSRLVTSVLREAGWKVEFLGASVPVAHLAQFLQDFGPDVTALSCSLPTRLPRARHMVEASRQIGIPVMVGGRGFGPAGRWGVAIGANGSAPSARRALALLESPDWPRHTEPAPPLPTDDGEADLIRRRKPELMEIAFRKLAGRWPGMAAYDRDQLQHTEEDLGYLLEFLSAALYVDDVGLYTDFIEWMVGILTSRRVPKPALTAGLEVIAEAIRELLGDVPRAGEFIARALTV